MIELKREDESPPLEECPGEKVKVVAECKEFTLYADGHLESSPKVEIALWRDTLNISGRKGSEERLELALTLLHLAEHAAGHRSTAPEDLLERLSDTLGKMLIPILCTPQLDSAETKAEAAATQLKNAIASVKSATLAIARWKTSRPEPGSNHPGAATWEMQRLAKEIFRETRRQPTQREIRARLEAKPLEGEITAHLDSIRTALEDKGRFKRLTDDQIDWQVDQVCNRMRAKGRFTEEQVRDRAESLRNRLERESEEQLLTEHEIQRELIHARQEMEEKGWRILSKDAESRWHARFKKAGLEDLPVWAPP